ncbi:hypothetical protein [Sabulibacter ruber]|uniref:hypothetical protein n=1 Tax=Sabulibacter ruber TaxID=2811901 RepID=UPI001A97A308|nr:hypothetical protein [Sabulibacter ruber]
MERQCVQETRQCFVSTRPNIVTAFATFATFPDSSLSGERLSRFRCRQALRPNGSKGSWYSASAEDWAPRP